MPPERWHELATILDACDQAVREAQARIAIPQRFSLGVREMFALQPRLEHPRGRRALRVLEHPRFRAAYDLLLLRAQLGLASQRDRRLVDAAAGGSAEERETTWPMHRGRVPRPPRAATARRRGRRRRRRSGPAAPVLTSTHAERWQPAYVGLGSNLSDPEHQVRMAAAGACGAAAAHLLRARVAAVRVAPVGPGRPAGLRQRASAGMLTQLPAAASCCDELRDASRSDFGRPRAARALGAAGHRPGPAGPTGASSSADAELTLPHPGIVERNFVLYPLADIAPDLEVPGLGRVPELQGRAYGRVGSRPC